MKNVFIFVFIFVGLQACKSLTSTTYIPPTKTFVLGEGKHSGYGAEIKNIGKDALEVIQIDAQGASASLGILERGEKKEFKILANCTMLFKNQHTAEQGIIQVVLKNVNSSLSMGYQQNK
jgi:hypothetical protein